MKKYVKYLPKKFRYSLFRNNLNLLQTLPRELSFKVATTQQEYLQALEILHQCYLEKGYTKKNKSNIRVTPYHLLPITTVLLALWKNEIIGTISIIRDNPLGVPMDKSFDLSKFRQKGTIVAEISALAIKKEFRGKSGEIFFPFVRFTWNLSYHFLGIDYFVIAVNPSMSELYESIYLFKPLPLQNRIVNYDFANNNPAVGQYINLRTSFIQFADIYKSARLKNNLYCFMKQFSFGIDQYPLQKYFTHFYTPTQVSWFRQLHYLLDEKLSDSMKNKIAQTFGYVSFQQMEDCPHLNRFRIPVSFHILNLENSKIINISVNGIAIQTTHILNNFIPIVIQCEIGPNNVTSIIAEPIWNNKSGVHGMKVLKSSKEWQQLMNELPLVYGESYKKSA